MTMITTTLVKLFSHQNLAFPTQPRSLMIPTLVQTCVNVIIVLVSHNHKNQIPLMGYLQSQKTEIYQRKNYIFFLSNQLRIDFNLFVISGPSTATTSTVSLIGGQPFIAGRPANQRTRCLTDYFSVSGSLNGNPSTVCGTNTNQHSEITFF